MKKILIVEDDHFYCSRLKEIISEMGFGCIISSDLQNALKIDYNKIDAAIIDVMLPNDPEISGISLEETRGNYLAGISLCREIFKKVPTFPIVLFSADIIGNDAKKWAQKKEIPFVCKSEGPERIINALKSFGLFHDNTPQTFIVHGHDEKTLLEIKNFIQNSLKWKEPIILREQPSHGKTIIEKFEEQTPLIDYIFILLTPDDTTINPDDPNEKKRRARQNVIFELGFFYGQYGRLSGKIIVLHKGPIEIPTDIHGIIWIDISTGIEAASEQIRKELKC